jgi:tetrahydromethanopterin S-methyltransferase subunit D
MKIWEMIVSPITGLIQRRQERKIAQDSAKAKLLQAKHDSDSKLELNDQELEVIMQKGLSDTWKDEYVTVSFVSIINGIVLGGVAAAFGYPQLLQGIGIAVNAIDLAGVDIGFILNAVVMAAIGLSIWRKA